MSSIYVWDTLVKEQMSIDIFKAWVQCSVKFVWSIHKEMEGCNIRKKSKATLAPVRLLTWSPVNTLSL